MSATEATDDDKGKGDGISLADEHPRGAVCTHPRAAEIDADIARKVPLDRVPKRWNLDITRSAVSKHANRHLRPALRQAYAARVEDAHATDAPTLLDQLGVALADVQSMVAEAKVGGIYQYRLGAARELRELLKLLGQTTGELGGDGPQVTVNLAQSAEVRQVLHAVTEALTPYPAARIAVAEALVGGPAAEVIEVSSLEQRALPAGSEDHDGHPGQERPRDA